MKKSLKWLLILFYSVFSIIILLFLIRLFSPRQLDDVSPEIPCSEDLLLKSDTYFVIPKYNNLSIAENPSWCKYILSFNKTLQIHGVYHTYKEFSIPRSESYVLEGKTIFENCFNFTPEEFKPPQVAIIRSNYAVIKKYFHLDSYFNQVTHKIYHCNDSDKRFPNRFADIF